MNKKSKVKLNIINIFNQRIKKSSLSIIQLLNHRERSYDFDDKYYNKVGSKFVFILRKIIIFQCLACLVDNHMTYLTISFTSLNRF